MNSLVSPEAAEAITARVEQRKRSITETIESYRRSIGVNEARLKEQLFDAEQAAWEDSPDGQAERTRAVQLVADAEAEQARRELDWAARHPAEWAEWVRIAPLLMPSFDFVSSAWFDFPAFLTEVGSCPSPRHAIERRDEALPYGRGNLTWRKQGRVGVGPRPSDSPYMTVDEAAAYTRRSRKTVLNHHSLGNVRSMPGTRPPLFRKEDLDRWLSAGRPKHRK